MNDVTVYIYEPTVKSKGELVLANTLKWRDCYDVFATPVVGMDWHYPNLRTIAKWNRLAVFQYPVKETE